MSNNSSNFAPRNDPKSSTTSTTHQLNLYGKRHFLKLKIDTNLKLLLQLQQEQQAEILLMLTDRDSIDSCNERRTSSFLEGVLHHQNKKGRQCIIGRSINDREQELLNSSKKCITTRTATTNKRKRKEPHQEEEEVGASAAARRGMDITTGKEEDDNDESSPQATTTPIILNREEQQCGSSSKIAVDNHHGAPRMKRRSAADSSSVIFPSNHSACRPPPPHHHHKTSGKQQQHPTAKISKSSLPSSHGHSSSLLPFFAKNQNKNHEHQHHLLGQQERDRRVEKQEEEGGGDEVVVHTPNNKEMNRGEKYQKLSALTNSLLETINNDQQSLALIESQLNGESSTICSISGTCNSRISSSTSRGNMGATTISTRTTTPSNLYHEGEGGKENTKDEAIAAFDMNSSSQNINSSMFSIEESCKILQREERMKRQLKDESLNSSNDSTKNGIILGAEGDQQAAVIYGAVVTALKDSSNKNNKNNIRGGEKRQEKSGFIHPSFACSSVSRTFLPSAKDEKNVSRSAAPVLYPQEQQRTSYLNKLIFQQTEQVPPALHSSLRGGEVRGKKGNTTTTKMQLTPEESLFLLSTHKNSNPQMLSASSVLGVPETRFPREDLAQQQHDIERRIGQALRKNDSLLAAFSSLNSRILLPPPSSLARTSSTTRSNMIGCPPLHPPFPLSRILPFQQQQNPHLPSGTIGQQEQFSNYSSFGLRNNDSLLLARKGGGIPPPSSSTSNVSAEERRQFMINAALIENEIKLRTRNRQNKFISPPPYHQEEKKFKDENKNIDLPHALSWQQGGRGIGRGGEKGEQPQSVQELCEQVASDYHSSSGERQFTDSMPPLSSSRPIIKDDEQKDEEKYPQAGGASSRTTKISTPIAMTAASSARIRDSRPFQSAGAGGQPYCTPLLLNKTKNDEESNRPRIENVPFGMIIPVQNIKKRKTIPSGVPRRRKWLPLGMGNDGANLSSFLCFLRHECIEVFVASRNDVVERMTSKKVREGQVGIRCRFCAHLSQKDRVGRSSNFPSSMSQIYPGVSMMIYQHFTRCPHLPSDLRDKFDKLKNCTKKGNAESRSYWVSAAKRLGMIDAVGQGGEHHHIKIDPRMPFVQLMKDNY